MNTKPQNKYQKPKMPRPKESNVQKMIIDYLCSRPDITFVIRLNSGKIRRGDKAMYDAVKVMLGAGLKTITAEFLSAFKDTSVVDVLALLNDGRLLAVEVKRDSKAKVEPHQHAFIKMVQDGGGIGLIAWNIEQLKDVLDAY